MDEGPEEPCQIQDQNWTRERPRVVGAIPESVDDFLRNFLLRHGLVRTLDCFQREWYQNQDRHQRRCFPDALTQQTLLQSELAQVREEAGLLRGRVLDLDRTLLRLQRERDFHRERSACAESQKGALCADAARLKEHQERLGPALTGLTRAHRTALRARTLVTMETQQILREAELRRGEAELRSGHSGTNSSALDKPRDVPRFKTDKSEIKLKQSQTTRSEEPRICEENTGPAHFTLSCSIRAHHQPISNIEVHPIRRLLASSSDDRSWRLWELPTNQERVGALLLSGEGHSDWLTSCCFSPDGEKLATTSGDATVRVWELQRGRCLLSLPGHLSSTWCCSFHRSGLVVASASSDRTVRLWDLPTGHAHILRRHGNAVSSVHFLPRSEHFLLSSGRDGTLVLWDVRAKTSERAINGHQSAVNHCSSDHTGGVVASCDAGGVVHLWDVRALRSPLGSAHTSAAGANQVSFCPGGSEELAVAGGDGQVRVLRPSAGHVTELGGHVGQVCSVRYDHQGETLLSAGTDGRVRLWRRTTPEQTEERRL